MKLPETLYTAAQTRELDRRAIEEHGITGQTLMKRAGIAAFDTLRRCWPQACRIAVVCGPGNNGGDGYVIGRLAREAGLEPVVMALGDPEKQTGDALRARQDFEATGGVHAFAPALLDGSEVIVDALFGTGLEREVKGEWLAAIKAMNHHPAPVLAVDMPSGLHADSGRILRAAVHAQQTVTFIGLKAGMFTADGPDCCGGIAFDDLGVPAEIYTGIGPLATRIEEDALRGLLPRRWRNTHKGRNGRILLIGGDRGMPGAVRLAGEAAYRVGAGLVYVATHPDHADLISANCPELVTRAVAVGRELRAAMKNIHVLAVGPGLGQGQWGRDMLAAVLESPLPKVLDADALNLLAAEPQQREDWVLTPHPAEAARLLACATVDIQNDRFEAARALAQAYGGVCVLKGAGTLIAAKESISLCDRGNPGMATAGMGDVLAGAVAGLLGQGLTALDAACLGVWLHAAAGDDVAKDGGEVGLMPRDLMPHLRRRLNRLILP